MKLLVFLFVPLLILEVIVFPLIIVFIYLKGVHVQAPAVVHVTMEIFLN